MAQIDEKTKRAAERTVRRMRGNPMAIALAIAVSLAVAGVCGIGIYQALQAPGVVYEAAGEREAEELPADEEQTAGGDEAEEAESPDEAEEAEPATIVVDVGGAVANPRVVELLEGARVADAIEAAGGLEPNADITSLNRAAPLQDGDKVYVPLEGEDAPEQPDAGASATAGVGTDSSGPVNINSATLEELDELPGVGPSTAQAIIDEREANGPFASAEDIMRVSGIGEKKFEKMKDAICV